MLLQSAPLLCGYCIAAVAGTWAVGVAQCIIRGAPVVGQKDYAVHIVHIGLGKADARAAIEDISPFLVRQCAPLVRLVAAVAYRVVNTPVVIRRTARQVGRRHIY